MAAILLGLTSSLAWGIGDFLAGVEARRRPLSAVLIISQAAGLTAACAVALVSGEAFPSLEISLTALGAGTLMITSIATFYRALTVGRMGVVTPIMATSATIPVVAGLLSGDRLSTVEAWGVGLCCVGVILTTRQPAAEGPGDRRGGIGLAFVGMVCFGCFVVAFDHAASESLFWSVALTRVVAVAAVFTTVAAVAGMPHLPTGLDAGRIALIGLLDVTALTALGLATDQGLLSIVAVLASLYPAVTILLARLLLDERLARIQGAGIAVALTGVSLLSLA